MAGRIFLSSSLQLAPETDPLTAVQVVFQELEDQLNRELALLQTALTLGPSGVVPGTYTHTTVTVNSQGLIINISNGVVTVGTVTSVAFSGRDFNITGSPITTSGTISAPLKGLYRTLKLKAYY